MTTLLAAGCGLLVGTSPLITCVRQGHVDTMKVIVAHRGVDLEWTDNERRTALIVAAQLNHQDIVNHLISAGIDLTNCFRFGDDEIAYFSVR